MKQFIKQNEGQIYFTLTVLLCAFTLIILDITNIITIK
jgi:hypothetical protein